MTLCSLSPMIMSDPKQPNAFFLLTIPLLRACGPSVSVAELVLSSGFLSALHKYTCSHWHWEIGMLCAGQQLLFIFEWLRTTLDRKCHKHKIRKPCQVLPTCISFFGPDFFSLQHSVLQLCPFHIHVRVYIIFLPRNLRHFTEGSLDPQQATM